MYTMLSLSAKCLRKKESELFIYQLRAFSSGNKLQKISVGIIIFSRTLTDATRNKLLLALAKETATPWPRIKPQVTLFQHVSVDQLASEVPKNLLTRGCLILLVGQGFILSTCGNSTEAHSSLPHPTDMAVSGA